MERLICQNCGSPLHEEGGLYKCRYCGSTYRKDQADRIAAMLSDALDDLKMEALAKARRAQYDAVHTKYPTKAAVVAAATAVTVIRPEDFLAKVYLRSYDGDPHALVRLLANSDVTSAEAKETFNWLIGGLSPRLIGPLRDFAGRHLRDKALDEALFKLEEESARVEEGIYDASLPRDVFLCYSSGDMPRVIETMEALEENDFSCWAAFRNLRAGRGAAERYNEEIQKAMKACKCVVFLSSSSSRTPRCDAVSIELPFLTTDLPNKPRAEYLLEDYPAPGDEDHRVPVRAMRILKEVFDGLQRVRGEEELIDRVDYMLSEGQRREQEKVKRIAEEAAAKAREELLAEINAKEAARKKLEEEQLKKSSEEKAKREAEEKARREREEAERKEREEAAKKLQEERLALEKERLELEKAKAANAKKDKAESPSLGGLTDEEAFLAMMQKAEKLAEEKRRKEQEERQKKERELAEQRRIKEEQLRKEAEEKAKIEAEKRKAAEEKARKEAEEKAKIEAEKRKAAEEKARKEAEEKAKIEAEKRKVAEAKIKKEVDEKAITSPVFSYDGKTVWYGIYPQKIVTLPQIRETLAPKKKKAFVNIEHNGKYYMWDKRGNLFRCAPIEWIVMKREGDEFALLSKYVLDRHCFHSGDKPRSYYGSELREWLNGEFLSRAFPEGGDYLVGKSSNFPYYGDGDDKAFVYFSSYFGFDSKKNRCTSDLARAEATEFAGNAPDVYWSSDEERALLESGSTRTISTDYWHAAEKQNKSDVGVRPGIKISKNPIKQKVAESKASAAKQSQETKKSTGDSNKPTPSPSSAPPSFDRATATWNVSASNGDTFDFWKVQDKSMDWVRKIILPATIKTLVFEKNGKDVRSEYGTIRKLVAIDVDPKNPYWCNCSGCLVRKSDKRMVWAKPPKNGYFKLPKCIKSIDERAYCSADLRILDYDNGGDFTAFNYPLGMGNNYKGSDAKIFFIPASVATIKKDCLYDYDSITYYFEQKKPILGFPKGYDANMFRKWSSKSTKKWGVSHSEFLSIVKK